MKWESIETAPKDGTKILAFGRGTDAITWDDKEKMPYTCAVIWWKEYQYESYEPIPGTKEAFKKVYVTGIIGWSNGSLSWFTPTHWTPLPMPPKGLPK